MSFDAFALILIALFFIIKIGFIILCIWGLLKALGSLFSMFESKPVVVNININSAPKAEPRYKAPYRPIYLPTLDPTRTEVDDQPKREPPLLKEPPNYPRLDPPTIDHVPYNPPPRLT